MAKHIIFFIGPNGERIPFSEFLKTEKEKQGLTWPELDKRSGVKRTISYAAKNSNGHPNNPDEEKFQKIISGLGFQRSQFEIDAELAKKHRRRARIQIDYRGCLKQLGERLLEVNEGLPPGREQLLSSTFIRKNLGNVGEVFYQRFAHSHEDRKKVLGDLHRLENGKYAGISLQRQIQNKTGYEGLLDFEDGASEAEIIEEALIAFIQENQTTGDRLPKGTYIFVADILNREREARGLEPRSMSSVVSHASNIWYARPKKYRFRTGSPTQNGEKDLEDLVKDKIEGTKGKGVEELLGDEEPEDEEGKKETFFKYSSQGHQALLLYLTEPIHIEHHFGPGIELVYADFSESPDENTLLDKLGEKVDSLPEIPEDDEEVIGFVDDWLRCDLIYRDAKTGKYIVLEIKQNAVNRENGFPNADKARQQSATYRAGIQSNIEAENDRHIGDPSYVPIPEEVTGGVVAYTMDDFLRDHLERRDFIALTIDKRLVDIYTHILLHPEVMIPDKDDIEELVARSVHQEEETPRETKVPAEYLARRENFAELRGLIVDLPDNAANWGEAPVIFYPGENGHGTIVYSFGDRNERYSLVEKGRHRRMVEKWIDDGKIRVDKNLPGSLKIVDPKPI